MERVSRTKCSTESTEAFQAYIKGRHAWNRRNEEGLQVSIEYFEEAIKIDPDFALAYTGLADSFVLVSEYGLLPPREALSKARTSAQRALELDATLAEAYTTLAYLTCVFAWDWGRAEELFLRAIQIKPTYASAHQWYADFLAMQGRFDESITEIKLARQLNPLSSIINAAVGYCLYFARRYDQAIAEKAD
jgi:tetratricopeptide (TPR) repeat protein